MRLYIFLIFILILTSCAKEENYTSSIPYAAVEININTKIKYQFVEQAYYSEEFTQGLTGYGGVFVISNSDFSDLYAYDMCCPYESPQKNIIQKKNSFEVKCPKCGSVYNIIDGRGNVISGPSTQKLKAYRVKRDGYYYRIRN